MRGHPTIGIKTCLMLAAALVGAAVTWMPESRRAIAQADNGRNLAAQEEKPFDQKQTLAELRKKIAGQEDKPSGEVFKNIQVPLFQKLPAKYFLGAMEFLFSKSSGEEKTSRSEEKDPAESPKESACHKRYVTRLGR
jgi:hypothetical protein